MITLTAHDAVAPATSVSIGIEAGEDILIEPRAIEWAYPHDDGGTVLVMSEGTHLHVTASLQTIKNQGQRFR